MAEIVVQPPQQVQAGSVLNPPFVLRTTDPTVVFFYVWVFDSQDQVIAPDQVGGVVGKNPKELQGRAAANGNGHVNGTGDPQFTVFHDISISEPGTYRLVAKSHAFIPGQPSSQVLHELKSRPIHVSRDSVAAEEPSTEEQAILQTLRDGGLLSSMSGTSSPEVECIM
ncbi:hypothetical protein F5Y17DRAFT_375711 [Xylariaceae sp. FL0594]|nr:hypothetical protein F5Y17DRAFT_375711 [Xylariaceae sp. FL0594]